MQWDRTRPLSAVTSKREYFVNFPLNECVYGFQAASESPEFSREDKLLMLLRYEDRGWALAAPSERETENA
jgi:hypothetical protein